MDMAEILNSDNKVKVIAFYLPQYHSIQENDRAWGKGFTEWTNVKKAKPLFKMHFQPKVPMNKNYYNLLDDNTAIWQSQIAQENGIFGFCYYHYWFKNGKKLLEKPAERMLLNEKITIPFCFCWANENWTKRWDGGNDEIIVEQDYGDEEDWEEHFQYLLPFFKDSRYITMNEEPLFVIYRADEIENVNHLVYFLKKRCKEEGLKGCTIAFQHPKALFEQGLKKKYLYGKKGLDLLSQKNIFNYYIMFEPLYSCEDFSGATFFEKLKHIISYKKYEFVNSIGIKSPFLYDYDKIWKRIIDREYDDDRFIPGAFVNWDNTPRRKNGQVFINSTPEKFGNYFKILVQKIENSNVPNMVFITAWNEWGEGSYLEPDERYRYQYLNEIKRVLLR